MPLPPSPTGPVDWSTLVGKRVLAVIGETPMGAYRVYQLTPAGNFCLVTDDQKLRWFTTAQMAQATLIEVLDGMTSP